MTDRRRRWDLANQDKRRAHIIVGKAIRHGELIPKPCEHCGHAVGVHAHHEDYSKPLEVTWLCPLHHRQLHRKSQYPHSPRPLADECHRGHPLSGENLYVSPQGDRNCRACNRIAAVAYQRRKRA